MKVSKENKVLLGTAVVGAGILGFLYWKKKKKEAEEDLMVYTPEPVAPATPKVTIQHPVVGAVLDKNKLLFKGSKGLEVRELQRLLGVKIDGDFGNMTKAALLAKKGVTKISLNGYAKKKVASKAQPTAFVLPKKGQKVMAIQNDVSVFNAQKTAEGTYFNTGTKPFIGGSFDYGEHIGVFVASKVGGQYLINRNGVYYFVNGNAVKPY